MRDRAVRMVFEAERHGSQWEAICSVAEKLGPTPETVRKWVRRVEVDEGHRPGLTTDERARLKDLERENRELRRANEILKTASAFFAAELDGRTRSDRLHRRVSGTVRGRADLQDVAVRPFYLLVGETPAPVRAVDPRRAARDRDRPGAPRRTSVSTARTRSGRSSTVKASASPGAPWNG